MIWTRGQPMQDYLLDAWYVAAWEHELLGPALLARTLLDLPWIVYRKSDNGGYAMLEDRCPHRFAPLSLGRRTGDAIECRYHGLQFGPDGQCIHNPYSRLLPTHGGVRHPPVLARHGLIWFWPGDAARADPAAIPDFSFLDGQAVRRRHSHFNGHYELLVDNLMDLSHVDYLHRETFNTAGTHAEARHEVRSGAGHTLWNTWLIPRVRKFPILDSAFPGEEPIDQLTEMRWDPPASMALRIGWLPSGCTEADVRFSIINPHIVTPETRHSSHYFWSCEPNDETEAFARAVLDGEDKPMIEAVQQRMGSSDFWALKPLILRGDVGAIRARRRLLKLRQQEAAAATT